MVPPATTRPQAPSTPSIRAGRAVTLATKCYVFICLGCAQLETSERSDRLTCSTACRVRAHRNGRLQMVRAAARTQRIPPALLPQCHAIKVLRPDLAAEILVGRVDIEDIRAEIYQAFIERVFATGARS